MSIVIDRRLNDHNKSAINRERFIRRYKDQIKRAIDAMVSDRSIQDMEKGGDVHIPVKDIAEPAFRHGAGGDHDLVFPGNRTYNPGDRIDRPPSGGGAGGGGEAGSGQAQGDDRFVFSLSREEFMRMFFDDLELPRLARTSVGTLTERKLQRAGYTHHGAPTNLSVVRSVRNSLARRIALRTPLKRELDQRTAELDGLSLDHASDPLNALLELDIAELKRRIALVPFLDDIDLRYRHRIIVAQPITQAVMFCLMDVSASMDEQKKDLAKRFFTLLYLFLTRRYRTVEVIFIRHTENAEEVNEERFFRDPQSGGTVVYSALKLMQEVIAARYSPAAWNIYGAQVSDGDAFGADPEKSRGFLESELLPQARYYAYIEVPDQAGQQSTLAGAYKRITADHFAMREVRERAEIYPVLRDLFKRGAQ
jgi:uncharacterized sporulation protein YeaH/YhbH (DUF444 family)